ncbi:hypothetical protein F2Q68_00014197 [Brassica cretica]|uniref:Uncharacterized protein n=1 Tax=Brassica cretica TaxID=69181 RepID=A0A8S9HCC3_BRACR|nr:hypothetical protein F2Q68_00014197 [Brassica cretica]
MSSSFSFPRPTTTTDNLEDLYKVYGVDRAVVLDLAGATETPKTVRGGYCGAYRSFFHSCGLTFPIPEPVLEILEELGLSFTQILPNFLSHLIALLVRAREEGLPFGLGEFRHHVLVKRNKQNPGTFLVSPRPGRHVIVDVPYRDEKWHEQFFVFNVDRASVGDFDFSRLPRNWAENIAPSGSSLMSDEIRGLIEAPPVEGSEHEAKYSREVVATPSVQAQSSDRLVRHLVRRSSFRASGSASRSRASDRPPLISIRDTEDEGSSLEERSPILLSPGLEDETVPRPISGVGDLISLAGRMRSAGCRLPSLASSAEKKAYAKVAVASSKVMEAFKKYVVVMEDRENEAYTTQVVAQRAKIAAFEVERDQDICLASCIARRDIEKQYREVLESLKENLTSKKKEVSAKIQLQEVIANIDLLNKLKDGGLTVDAELARLKEMEGDCEGLVASAAVSDWSITELDLPQVSKDSVDQVDGSSVPDGSDSS